MALDFPPTLLHLWPTGMAKAFRYHGRREWETAVRLRLIVADFVLSRPEKGRVTVGCPFVASIAADRSCLEIARFVSPLFDLYRSRFAIVDLVIAAAGLSAVVDSVVPVVVAAAVVVCFVAALVAIAGFVDSAFVVYPSAAAMVKATAAVAPASCSSGRRSSSLHNRNCPLPLYFAARASGAAGNDRSPWAHRSAFCRHSSLFCRAGRASFPSCSGS